jgi:hypothetical protein
MPQYIGSTANLASTATYTSRWILTDNAPSLGGSVFADQAGTIYIEQSGDGVYADISASYIVTASAGSGFIEDILLPYARLRFTNTAGSDQTVFRLITKWTRKNT